MRTARMVSLWHAGDGCNVQESLVFAVGLLSFFPRAERQHDQNRENERDHRTFISAPSLLMFMHTSFGSALSMHKMIKVKGCAWLGAHQSSEQTHGQRISNRGESYITFSLSSLATSG
jgi:hypothetical protein